MKKYSTFLIAILCFAQLTIAQHSLQDAIELKGLLSGETFDYNGNKPLKIGEVDRIFEILSSYVESPSKTNIKNAFEKNPYISFEDPQGGSQSSNDLSMHAKSAGEAIKGLDITNLALGLTDFLIKRAKTELNTAFFKRFKKELDKEENKALKILFPKTLQLLNLIDVEIYQYDLYLNNMRIAFQEDLDQIYTHMPEVLEAYKKDVDELGTGTYELTMLGLRAAELNRNGNKGTELIGQLLRDQNYTKLIDALAGTEYKGEKDALYAILFLNMLAESFEDKNTDGTHLKISELSKLEDDVTLKIYLGLLYEVSKKAPYNHISFSGQLTNVEQLLAKIASKGQEYNAFKAYVIQVTSQVSDIDRSYQQLLQIKADMASNENLSQKQKNFKLYAAGNQLFSEVIQLLRLSENVDESLGMKGQLTKVQNIIETLENIGDLSTAALNKQYAQVVTETAYLLQKLLAKNEEVGGITAKVLRYGTFMAALVDAESPEQAQNAIEAAALPPGSYSIKRESSFSVALNGYIGGFYGNEDIGNDGGTGGFNNFAVTAPVGISLSFGNICKSWNYPWSIGLSLPILDLGTVASYRLDSDVNTVEDIPSIKLEHLLAPGAFAEFGIGGTPLTLGVGMQYGARLRNIQAGAAANTLGDTYFRYGLSLKVDIPLMQFVAIPAKRTH